MLTQKDSNYVAICVNAALGKHLCFTGGFFSSLIVQCVASRTRELLACYFRFKARVVD